MTVKAYNTQDQPQEATSKRKGAKGEYLLEVKNLKKYFLFTVGCSPALSPTSRRLRTSV